MMRSNITKLAVRRFGSSAVAKDTPREAVARNLLLHKAISEAKTEEQLAKLVAAPLPALTTEGVQQLGLADYLQRDFAPSVTKFTPDPTAWQNMKGADYVFTEAQRSETWPFLVGLGVTFALTLLIAGSRESDKSSKYLQLMERARGNAPADHGHGHAHH